MMCKYKCNAALLYVCPSIMVSICTGPFLWSLIESMIVCWFWLSLCPSLDTNTSVCFLISSLLTISTVPLPSVPPTSSFTVYIAVTFAHFPGCRPPAVLLCDLTAALPRVGSFIKAREQRNNTNNTHKHKYTTTQHKCQTPSFDPVVYKELRVNRIWFCLVFTCVQLCSVNAFTYTMCMSISIRSVCLPLTLWAPPQSPWRSIHFSGRSSYERQNQAQESLFQTQNRRSL